MTSLRLPAQPGALIGRAADVARVQELLLREAIAGGIFAAGHGEVGNDLPVLLSTASAKRVDGGYRFTGHKMFGSLTPVWTRLGVHGMDTSDPAQPKVIHGFVQRSSDGYRVRETWDTLGMRATRSDDTILEGVVVPDRYIARQVPPGAGRPVRWRDLRQCATELRRHLLRSRRARARPGHHFGPQAHCPGGCRVRWPTTPRCSTCFSEMQLELESMWPHLERIAEDWSNGVDHGPAWPMKIVAAKYHCVEGAKKVVDLALTSSGGAGMFKGNELERLYRDVRAGGFHPANTLLTHEIVGKTTLGIGLDEQPRWG